MGVRARQVLTRADPLVVATPKGRILRETAEVFQRAGFDLSPALGGSRKLEFDCGPLRIMLVRSQDVPTYVEYGVADVGVAGSDVLNEQGRKLYQPLDLGIGACRLIVAEHHERPVNEHSHAHIRVATKYPKLTRQYLELRRLTAEIIKLSGSIELAAVTKLADRVVDLVETGETLRQNGLVIVDTITEVTSRLVVNPATLKLRPKEIGLLVSRLADAIAPNTKTDNQAISA